MEDERIHPYDVEEMKQQLESILDNLKQHPDFARCKVLVVGCSTSEVIGKAIGTSGTVKVAEAIFQTVQHFCKKNQIQVAFQCCEHLNRALVTEAKTMAEGRYEEVSVVPVRSAGGALATYAYNHLKEPVVIEFIKADAGIDIGSTLIGMHLKHVAVPVRCETTHVGKAYVTAAVTRPKLIGGMRAVYEVIR
ncbi:TIGR01440 family protein [Bacillus testis]|uniref:TIGR01440 family protein n=1 Tax=Bacillus testis TaxID=1622072 RepID=UPI00067E7EA8|nr:TIGR01440 family protein [Bacillus testis]